jgi:hypothetical protein
MVRTHGQRRGAASSAFLRSMMLAGAMLAAGAGTADAQALPFSAGETCVYRGSSVLGRIGTGTMAVEPAQLDGASLQLMRFDFRGRVGPAVIEDHSRSWFDAGSRGVRRFTKRERSPLGSRNEDVQMDAAARRWRRTAGGTGGAMPTDAPLDELSFLYYIRTLRLANGDSYKVWGGVASRREERAKGLAGERAPRGRRPEPVAEPRGDGDAELSPHGCGMVGSTPTALARRAGRARRLRLMENTFIHAGRRGCHDPTDSHHRGRRLSSPQIS